MRISIDKDVCIGAGQCALTAPSVFTQDDDGFSALLPGREDGGGDPLVREAARACPVQAITLHDQRNTLND
ncbi:ferredoxin [Streptomyces sp. WM6378]|uniref:ferredoxin n=2 Tax=Streptomyces TaxID=1883 RepID=UPI0006AE25E6|nr:ferredoxin [Streptomyces sp. WM6378]KOU42810.1 ferredoxin [Streptomyces sp. WM6378]